jgi:hypothetical protein
MNRPTLELGCFKEWQLLETLIYLGIRCHCEQSLHRALIKRMALLLKNPFSNPNILVLNRIKIMSKILQRTSYEYCATALKIFPLETKFI